MVEPVESVSARTLRIAFSGSTSTPFGARLGVARRRLERLVRLHQPRLRGGGGGSKAASYTGTPRSLGNHESVPLSFSPFSPQTMFTSSSLGLAAAQHHLGRADVLVLLEHVLFREPLLGVLRHLQADPDDATPPAKRPANTSRITHFAGPFRKLK